MTFTVLSFRNVDTLRGCFDMRSSVSRRLAVDDLVVPMFVVKQIAAVTESVPPVIRLTFRDRDMRKFNFEIITPPLLIDLHHRVAMM
jgi:delta-aminolevulinic acid dehydratase/porphobilinogen synthase